MGCDVCYTNHAEADQDDMDNLLTLLAAAGCNYFMGVPGADDVMLNYQSTSFHDSHYLRQVLGLRPAPEFEEWLQTMQIADREQPAAADQPAASFDWQGGNVKTDSPVTPDAWHQLREATPARIALGRAGGSLPTREWLQFKAAHAAARDAVHNAFDAEGLAAEIAALGVETVVVDSAAPDRFAYLQRPDLGRRLKPASEELLKSLRRADAAPELAIIVSDGLSALAAHRQTTAVLAALLPLLSADNWRLSPIVIARFGRVALEDQIGQLLGAQIALMLIGERPGLGSPDSLGAYLVFDPPRGQHRRQPQLRVEHSPRRPAARRCGRDAPLPAHGSAPTANQRHAAEGRAGVTRAVAVSAHERRVVGRLPTTSHRDARQGNSSECSARRLRHSQQRRERSRAVRRFERRLEHHKVGVIVLEIAVEVAQRKRLHAVQARHIGVLPAAKLHPVGHVDHGIEIEIARQEQRERDVVGVAVVLAVGARVAVSSMLMERVSAGRSPNCSRKSRLVTLPRSAAVTGAN